MPRTLAEPALRLGPSPNDLTLLRLLGQGQWKRPGSIPRPDFSISA